MKEYIQWFIKGASMGMADIVPGVSGGTLAFILGIYERFIAALTSFDVSAVQLLLKGQIKKLWQHVDGTFLLCVFLGILTAIFSLANLISFLLETHPVPVWSFFCGLIIASLPMLLKKVQWSALRALLFVVGAVFAVLVTALTPMHNDPSLVLFFGAGFIAISAMMLPGISGSFLLLIMGMYAPITAAVSNLEITVLAVFALGCISGLLVFSRVLNWALHRVHDAMLAVLSGIVLGALLRIWPWQVEGNLVTPAQYAEVHTESYLLIAVITFILGGALIQLLLHLEKLFGTTTESS
ncbi:MULTISPECIES: DUF368 domain-containing protein [Gammaproteobacteria]|uniref:DUF368 domain-containing protein n=1 Tax=Gammaproteobacteria TaxID=1236 RepID=UPI000DCFF5D8|nr:MULTISPECIES: DUF368 domain-containing protein [Gammaproteobacteria]RTE86021.1 DUF368 domain-containing protein [Aliidiomarina sp. B3213]TCZ91375.1 DUF368 domain-containing protein [Lysobacter sp. N42]